MKEKKGLAVREAFFPLTFTPLSPSLLLCNLLIPLDYKRESRMPHEGHENI